MSDTDKVRGLAMHREITTNVSVRNPEQFRCASGAARGLSRPRQLLRVTGFTSSIFRNIAVQAIDTHADACSIRQLHLLDQLSQLKSIGV